MIEPAKQKTFINPKTGEVPKTEQSFTYGINDSVEITRLPNDYTTPENTLRTFQNCAILGDMSGFQRAVHPEAKGIFSRVAIDSEVAEKIMQQVSDGIIEDSAELRLGSLKTENDEYKAYEYIASRNKNNPQNATGTMIFRLLNDEWKIFDSKYNN